MHGKNTDNSSTKIYLIKIESRITFKIKTGYHFKLLRSGTMKLLGSTENKMAKDENGENVPHFEIIEVVLVQCDFLNKDYQQNSKLLMT